MLFCLTLKRLSPPFRTARKPCAASARVCRDSSHSPLVGTLADTHIIDVLHRFARRSRDVRLELRTASSAGVTDLVRRGEATLGLRYFSSNHPDLTSLSAGSEAMLVVAASNHSLAGQRIRNA